MSGSGGRPLAKRRKTLRACDYCRLHRIRCDFPPDSDTCKHCEDYDILCERIAPAPKDERAGRQRRSIGRGVREASQGLEPGYLGQSSVSCQALACLGGNAPGLDELYGRYDQYSIECGRQRDRVMLVGRDARGNTGICEAYSPQQARSAAELCSASVLEDLIRKCRVLVVPQFPVISISESFSQLEREAEADAIDFGPISTNSTPPTPLPPIVQLVMAAIPALSRDTPSAIRQSILAKLHRELETVDMAHYLQTSSIASVQILLLLGWSPELHDTDAYRALSLRWLRSGAATRMAYEMALHRDLPSGLAPVGQLHRRRRVWGGCIVADRWMALQSGRTMGINLDDCDAQLPHWFADHVPRDPGPGGNPCFRYHCAMTELAILLGRAYSLTCTPSGLKRADDRVLYVFQNDLEAWEADLPPAWPYLQTLDVTQAHAVLDLLSTCVEYTFVRPFIWPSQPIPASISFRPSARRLERLHSRSAAAIAWAASAGQFYLDTWLTVSYALMCCVMLQYQGHLRTGSAASIDSLRLGATVFRDWADARAGDSCGERLQRNKFAEFAELLHAAAAARDGTALVDGIPSALFDEGVLRSLS